MRTSVLRSEEEYDVAVARLYDLMQTNVPFDSKESQELEQLARMVEAYEDKHYPVPLPDPVEAIKFRLEQMREPKY